MLLSHASQRKNAGMFHRRDRSCMNVVLLIVLCVLISPLDDLRAQDCTDRLLLDANERAFAVGLDTSGVWWALTKQYEEFTGLVIDGRKYGPYESVLTPKVSYDGSNVVAGVKLQNRWHVLTMEDTVALEGDVLQEVYFPSQSSTPWWYHTNGNDRRLSTYERSYRCVNEPRMVCFDPQGMVIAWVERRGNVDVLFENGQEHVTADEIKLSGVWADGAPVYAVRFGTRWSVYRGHEEIMSSLASLSEITLNTLGSACAWIASDGSGTARVYLYTTEMNAPWTSLPVQSAWGLVLSPFDPLVAARTVRNGNNVVNFSGAEYPSGRQTGPISFSHDGALLVYAGVDGDHFVTINGKRSWLKGAVNLGVPVQISTDGSAVGWASATTLAYVNLDLNILRMGRMCDTMGPVIYDRRTQTFKGLGFVSGRLFLLECDPR